MAKFIKRTSDPQGSVVASLFTYEAPVPGSILRGATSSRVPFSCLQSVQPSIRRESLYEYPLWGNQAAGFRDTLATFLNRRDCVARWLKGY